MRTIRMLTPAVLVLVAAVTACAGSRPAERRPIPPAPPSALAVLSVHSGELGLDAGQIRRLEGDVARLAEATAQDRRELEEGIAARSRPPRSPAGQGAGEGPGQAQPPSRAWPEGGAPGRMGGHGGGRREGALAPAGHGEAARRHVDGLLRRIEDAEMKAYLETESWLPGSIRDRCRELVGAQRDRLLERHAAIRERLGIQE